MRVVRCFETWLFAALLVLTSGCGEESSREAAGEGAGGAPGSGGGSGGQGADRDAATDPAGSGGGSAADASVVDVTPARRPPCITKASQVIVVGDSYINYNEQLNPDLASRAVADGALQQGEEWRMYALAGASMASGGIIGFDIPIQFQNALLADPDMLVGVMTGGGNDILIPNALFLGESNGLPVGAADCKNRADADQVKVCVDVMNLALDTASKLMVDAADAGVQDVIYFFYPNLPGGGLGGTNPNVILNFAYPHAQALCDDAVTNTGGRLHCHFIDMRPVFDGHADWFQADGIHPTAPAHDAMADEIWGLMHDRCIAHTESSGCCEPQ